MLDQALKEQVKSLFAALENQYILCITVADNHPERSNLVDLLTDVAETSENVALELHNGEGLSFSILKNNEPASFHFQAVPTGHEFTSLLLAILNLDGKGKNFPDEAITRRIQALKGPIKLRSYISLSCTNCPEVVQTINMMSILNPAIQHEIIDGSLVPEEVNRLNIQAVPAIYADEKSLSVGRTGLGELLSKLEESYDSQPVSMEPVIRKFDVVIVGGGPAGTSAAIYSARKGFSVAIIAEKMGGQILETVGIENMISIPATTGRDLAVNLRRHLGEYPIEILENRKVERFEVINGEKYIHTSLGETIIAPALIITTGASWRKLNIPGESEYIGSGIAFCTHCDGPFYKDKRVAVIGGGNSGLEAAIDLSGIAKEVTVLEFADELKGDIVLQEKIKHLPNVTTHTQIVTEQIFGNGSKVTGIQIKNRLSGEIKKLELDGVFIQIGLKANSAPFDQVLETNRMGEILIDAHCRTNIPGIYAAGDVSTVPFKQIIIAMGEGAKAALTAFEDQMMGRLIQ